ncbi:unnamed protein product [Adineta ricciae]|uniref:Uncharacterized protein n=1 Tax=Adineta ricciae TaxID=249248 RepID=A0A816AHA7_ADIRI|nr:unnamed protein product [Adineta ricciae]
MTLLIWLKSIIKRAFDNLLTWNAINSRSSDPTIIRRELFTTRLYFILLIVSLVVLTTYTSFIVRFNIQSLLNLTYSQYQQHHNDYSNTLQCSSISYKDFVTIEVKYYQICLSEFVQSWWYQSLLLSYNTQGRFCFVTLASSYFQTLTIFCELANEIINNGTEQFLSTTFVNGYVLFNDSFYVQMTSLINSFIDKIEYEFVYRMSLTQLLLHNNSNKRCYCVLDFNCTLKDKVIQGGILIPVSWQIGEISIYLVFQQKLHPTLSNRYSPTTLTETIFNNLMIEDWIVTYSYDNYYSQCHPSSCSFTYEKKTDFAYLLTVIVSLIGGINLILRLISPHPHQIQLEIDQKT